MPKLLTITVAILGLSSAAAQVVANDACPKYAVDIAAYATCDSVLP
jgi:hypothetical protein